MHKENKKLDMPFNAKKANRETIEFLIKLGILYEDENGIHVVNERR